MILSDILRFVYVVSKDDGEVVGVFTSEPKARRYCKDNGYSYQKFKLDDY